MTDSPSEESVPPQWQPLSAIDRRVAGVLVEKAKTTPNAYPLSLNAVCTAANQKSNRVPVMDLEPADAEESLDRLRKLGAVGLIEGYGRVSKYRHYLYKWLGVDKVEIAVMAELLLRGAQTVGELRGRAARMEPIRDLAELRPVIESLEEKGLVIALSPEGRGQVVTHALFPPEELARLQSKHASSPSSTSSTSSTASPGGLSSEPAPHPAQAPPAPPEGPGRSQGLDRETAEATQHEVEELRAQVAQLRSEMEDLAAVVEKLDDQFSQLRRELGG